MGGAAGTRWPQKHQLTAESSWLSSSLQTPQGELVGWLRHERRGQQHRNSWSQSSPAANGVKAWQARREPGVGPRRPFPSSPWQQMLTHSCISEAQQ